MFKPPSSKDKLSSYIDASGEFSNRSLKLGEWYVRHQIMLREIFVGSLVAFIIIFGGFSFYKWTDYLFFGYTHDELNRADLLRNYIPIAASHAHFEPLPLEFTTVQTFTPVADKYDFVSSVTNHNSDWEVTVSYKFTFDNGESRTEHTLVLPGMTVPLAALGTAASAYPGNPNLVVLGTAWQRIDHHTIPDALAFTKERIHFVVDNFNFVSAVPSQGILNHTISFNLINDSTYGYWQPEFYIIYKNGDQTVGIKSIAVDTFRAHESRPIELKSLVEQLNVTSVEVVPLIDVFNKDGFIAPGL